MFKRCSNCKYCRIDLKALNIGVFAEKCYKKNRFITHSFWNGWWCKEWRAYNVK